jgi:hypothetical protein
LHVQSFAIFAQATVGRLGRVLLDSLERARGLALRERGARPLYEGAFARERLVGRRRGDGGRGGERVRLLGPRA